MKSSTQELGRGLYTLTAAYVNSKSGVGTVCQSCHLLSRSLRNVVGIEHDGNKGTLLLGADLQPIIEKATIGIVCLGAVGSLSNS
jgi:hypothetical protein